MKRILATVLLACCSLVVKAEIRIHPDLRAQISKHDLATLESFATDLFRKEISEIDYTFDDSPPIGDPAAVVRFQENQVDAVTYEFPRALFYHRKWFNTKHGARHDLPPEYKKNQRGNWYTEGRLNIQRRYKIALKSGPIFLPFGPGITYEGATSLLNSIELRQYEIKIDAASKDLHK